MLQLKLKQEIFPKVLHLMALIIYAVISVFFISCSNEKIEDAQENREYKLQVSRDLKSEKISTDSLKQLLKESISKNELTKMTLYYRELGRIMRDNANFSEAINYHQKGLDAALQLKDTIEIVQAYNNLGTNFRRIGALAEASEYHYSALNLAEAYSGANDPIGLKNKVVAMNGIGNISLSMNFLDDAEIYFRKALADEKRLKSPFGQAINYANIGAIFQKRNQLDSATYYYELSMEQNKIVNSALGMGLCCIHLGQIYEEKKQYLKAEEQYQKAYDMMSQLSDKWHWLESALSLARINLLMNNFSKSSFYIDFSEKTAEAISSPEHFVSIYLLKSQLYEKQGNFKEALICQQKSTAQQESILNIQKANRYLDMRVNYERNQNIKRIDEINRINREQQYSKQITIYVFIIGLVLLLIIIGVLFYAYRVGTNSNKLLKRTERMRSDFFAKITHEFRTPLTVILGLSKEIEEGTTIGEEEKRSYLSAIRRQGNSLLSLVNQLLDFSKLKSGVDTPQWKHGNIVLYISLAAEPFSLYARKKEIEMIFYSEQESFNADFVPSYIDKIVSNLLSNAIRYSPNGSKVHLVIAKSKNRNNLILKIIDNGRGINKQDLPHIFDMFYQCANSEGRVGSGIGLALTKGLVENLCGKIEVESVLGKGSTFTVTLPLRNMTLTDVPVWGAMKSENALLPEADIPSFVDGDEEDDLGDKKSGIPTVLLVEDNRDVMIFVRSLFKGDYYIIEAINGQTAFDIAEDQLPDIIISDIMMPIMDGVQLCSKIKHSSITNHIPVILLTAKNDEEDRINAFKCGADAFIAKPFNSEELLARVSQLLLVRNQLKEKYMGFVFHDKSSDNHNIWSNGKDPNMEFILKVTEVVEREMKNPELNSNLIATSVCMSVSQLNRKLNAITGYSTLSYVLQARLAMSKRLLLLQQKSIVEIADDCGFYDAAYFSRTFKKHFGVTPSQYQRLHTMTDFSTAN